MRKVAVGAALAFAAAGTIALALATSQAACTTHQCDGSFVFKEGVGRMVDPDTWESSAIEDEWLHYPGRRTYFFVLPVHNRRVVSIEPYVSFARQPLKPNAEGAFDNYTLASGDIAELERASGRDLVVRNDTCAEFYLRVVVRFARQQEGPTFDASVDGGVEAAADATAIIDAPSDAPAEGTVGAE